MGALSAKSARLRACAVAAVLVLTGCGSTASNTAADTSDAASSATASNASDATSDTTDAAGSASAEVDVAADGVVIGPVFETVDGSSFDLGAIEGTDTMLWFWAPW